VPARQRIANITRRRLRHLRKLNAPLLLAPARRPAAQKSLRVFSSTSPLGDQPEHGADKGRLSDKLQTYANSESIVFVPRPAIPQCPQPPKQAKRKG
jgi:hypothetical protein